MPVELGERGVDGRGVTGGGQRGQPGGVRHEVGPVVQRDDVQQFQGQIAGRAVVRRPSLRVPVGQVPGAAAGQLGGHPGVLADLPRRPPAAGLPVVPLVSAVPQPQARALRRFRRERVPVRPGPGQGGGAAKVRRRDVALTIARAAVVVLAVRSPLPSPAAAIRATPPGLGPAGDAVVVVGVGHRAAVFPGVEVSMAIGDEIVICPSGPAGDGAGSRSVRLAGGGHPGADCLLAVLVLRHGDVFPARSHALPPGRHQQPGQVTRSGTRVTRTLVLVAAGGVGAGGSEAGRHALPLSAP